MDEDWIEATRGVVLVEGDSDRAALEALADRRGRDLDSESVVIVPVGGATAVGRYMRLLAPCDVPIAGLCDAGEEPAFRRALARAGLRLPPNRAALEASGFFVCVADLEDELIRALGVTAVEQVVASQGELGSLRTFQKQPAQRGRAPHAQLRRFMGTRSGRKIHYARVLVEALDLDRVPYPLDGVLAHV
jgi:hypothetical protein